MCGYGIDQTPDPQGVSRLSAAAALARERILETARQVYRSYGFSPIDTPALEYAEILLGKGGDESDKQLFRFTDQGGRDVAMRFDLTVPFARFAAQHLNDIGTPFKRYHQGTVWRGENTQRGRYREFMQSDFDTIGTESNASDIETLLVIHDLFVALGFERFKIRVNNRLVLNGLLEKLGLAEKTAGVLRVLDKLHKVGRDGGDCRNGRAGRRDCRTGRRRCWSWRGSQGRLPRFWRGSKRCWREAPRERPAFRGCASCSPRRPRPALPPIASSSTSRSRAGSTITRGRSTRRF